MTIDEIFRATFNAAANASASAPGRVNLIGEHTDYNGGLVLPIAIGLRTEVAIGPSLSGLDEIVSDRFGAIARLAPDSAARGMWTDYASGGLQQARRAGWLDGPARLAISSNLPDGAGLSSSAALIVAILTGAARMAGAAPSITELARQAQRVEHQHIGVPCGVMDQMIIAANAGRRAMQLDTVSLDYQWVEVPAGWRLFVLHSGVTRKLDEGRYAQRRRECEAAAAQLGGEQLCRLSAQQEARIASLPWPLAGRARHALTDSARATRAAEAIRADDIAAFGAILNDGHASLRDDFEISTPQIDALVAVALEEGALGARLTGGGFGGCVLAVLPEGPTGDWQARVLERCPAASLVCEF